ncbi:hypothetical protein Peur_035074 [Populus x canadensis]
MPEMEWYGPCLGLGIYPLQDLTCYTLDILFTHAEPHHLKERNLLLIRSNNHWDSFGNKEHLDMVEPLPSSVQNEERGRRFAWGYFNVYLSRAKGLESP